MIPCMFCGKSGWKYWLTSHIYGVYHNCKGTDIRIEENKRIFLEADSLLTDEGISND
jgi:hypothetical protein